MYPPDDRKLRRAGEKVKLNHGKIMLSGDKRSNRRLAELQERYYGMFKGMRESRRYRFKRISYDVFEEEEEDTEMEMK
ncbi:hypothetical protein BOTNAR_1873g00010 [Botryotinia narcissicola]|uniref:Uncharacterized protein n=1 Tax=Botryotinia narcissicola TaxID=278944 RepID=A0A4Z1H480_9HELO|nr:hypothetical protein BOTNAR_1873g00010 [Botryotinia narcissicola]